MQTWSRNRTTQLLMGISLLLLLTFLLFWLRKEYKEQYELLAKDSNHLFDHIVSDVRDSLLFFDLQQKALLLDQRTDSLKQKKGFTYIQHRNNNNNFSVTIDSTDSIISSPRVRKMTPDGDLNFRFVPDSNSKEDNKKVVVRALSFALREFGTNDTINIKIGPDSLPAGRLYTLFSDTLAHVHDRIPFTIHRLRSNDSIPPHKGIVTRTTLGDYSLRNQYYAQIEGFQWYLIKKIAPQILFSVFLFSLTAFSFFLIYRSWQNQSRLTELKNDFISNVTHELKTPITTVGVALEALRDFEVLDNPQKTQEYLGISQNELKRLNLLVDKVLQMSKFEKQVPKLKIERIDMEDNIQQILDSMKLQFEKHEAEVDFTFTGNNFQMEGDRSHLSSVIYNLIDNALKYSNGKPRIQIRLKDIGDRLSLSVRDNGLGIPKAYQDKIFDKFFRIPTGDRHNVKGHGLGLSYVSGIIQQHKGSIHLESVEGKGSCFEIQFPKFQDIV